MKHNKLKLVCTFNGGFRRRSSDGKLRYTGGETRVISVDPTTLTYSKLHSIISDFFFRPGTGNGNGNATFTLKYRLLGSEPDYPLVLLTSNDDVRCMVEEYEYGNKPSRLWLFVCNNGDNYDNNCNDNDNNVIVNGVNSCARSDFGCGFRVSGRNMGCKGENLDAGFCGDFAVRSGMMNRSSRSRRVSDLRKMVLKQQLLARKQEQIQNLIGDYDVQSVNFGSEQSYDHPLLDSRPEIESIDAITRQLMRDQNVGGGSSIDGLVAGHPRPLNLRDGNLFEESRGCDHGMVAGLGRKPGVVLTSNLNRENILPFSQDCKELNSHSCCGDYDVGRDSMRKSSRRGHGGFILNDGKNQRSGCSCQNGGNYMARMDGKPSVATRWYPRLGASTTISMQGHAMRLDHSMETKRLFCPKWNHYGFGVQSRQGMEDVLIDVTSDEPVVEHGVQYEQCNERTIHCEPDCQDANVKVNCHTGCGPIPVGFASSIDLSSYNPSLSSSKSAPSPPSHASSEVSEASKINDLKLLNPVVEEKAVAEMKGSTTTKFHSVNGVMAKTLHQEMQSLDGNVDTRKFHNNSSILNTIPCDLQTIKDSDLEYIKELGSGNYGAVYYGKWKGSDVAIKKIKLSCISGDAKEDDRLVADFWKEACMLWQLHHPNIVAFYGVVTDGPITKLATVTEYMVNGSLKQVLQKKDRTIDRRKRVIIAMGAAFGMEYLHEKGIVHFDLKSHNFLVNMRDPQHPVCKIGDLGLSKIKKRSLVSGGVRGTIPWMAPELLSTTSNLVTEKVDVYSFGIVMWELLTGEEPYANMRSQEIIAGILKGTLRPEIPRWCDPAWRSLMERCWSSDPESRPSFSEVAKELRAMSAAMNIK